MSAQHRLRCGAYSPLTMAMTCAPDEADRKEPIMMVPTEQIEVRDLRYQFNLPPDRLCEDLSGPYKAEATITIAPQHRQSFAEMLDGIKQSREAPTVKPRSKRGQRGRRWQ